jgi:hypothetical protein
VRTDCTCKRCAPFIPALPPLSLMVPEPLRPEVLPVLEPVDPVPVPVLPEPVPVALEPVPDVPVEPWLVDMLPAINVPVISTRCPT